MKNCRDMAYLISSDGLEDAGWVTRLLARLHLGYCKVCRRYAAEVAKIGIMAKETSGAEPADPKAVERIGGAIMDYATGAQGGTGENVPDEEGELT